MGDARKIVGPNIRTIPATENSHTVPRRNAFRSGTFSGRLLTGLVGGAALFAVSSSGCAIPLSNSPSGWQFSPPQTSPTEKPSVKEDRKNEFPVFCPVLGLVAAGVGGALVHGAYSDDASKDEKAAVSLVGGVMIGGVTALTCFIIEGAKNNPTPDSFTVPLELRGHVPRPAPHYPPGHGCPGGHPCP